MVRVEVIAYGEDEEAVELLEAIRRLVGELGLEGLVDVVLVDPDSPEVMGRYGILPSPTVAVDGVAVFIGRVPSMREVADVLVRAAQLPFL